MATWSLEFSECMMMVFQPEIQILRWHHGIQRDLFITGGME
nr:hypothetical protein Iba_scaffold34285CG0020 [Ipomoea batatas]GMD10484.1 hypothetical protein Iba_chr06eCG6690 [Ipomoea batatas]GMD11829.1 hypothetical protein Iba_chr06fCG7430 [Ipomoea batatas]GMD72535.1 hypothetical protein Iba_chr12fCG9520 [Ipomoea batatas]GME20604.1 hypothetical protein Iba_scaffold25593CG0020 [Ipomoea batatas]